jgi:uncharacterized repeat protein (TIGR01451 family)
MRSLPPHRSDFPVRGKFYRIDATRFLLSALISLCFVTGSYFAPALLSGRQSPSRPAAAMLPNVSGATGEHTATGQVPSGENVKAPAAGVAEARVREVYGRLPMAFEDNAGQYDDKVKYSARGIGFQIFLTSDEAVLALGKPSTQEDGRDRHSQVDQEAPEQNRATGSGAVLRMKLVGANRRPGVKGENELAAKSNYFVGAKPEHWHTGVAMFEKVRYAEVYPGIDVVYYGNQRQLEYDFVLAPHADPDRIKFKFSGAQDLHLDAEGHLLLQTDGGYVRQEKPLLYQLVDGRRQEIAGRYAVKESGEIGFEVGRYDRARPLVIDPVLSYSTYLGGTGNDRAFGIALDGQGNAYITGETSSTDFPTANAYRGWLNDALDAFVLKLNPSGTAPVYATYFGGDSIDSGYGIAVDAAGNAYVTGVTYSDNFLSTSGVVQRFNGGNGDGFVAKLNAAGNGLVYSSYLGGENLDQGYGVAVDAAGNAYVTGDTDSNSFSGIPMPKQGNPVYKSDDAGASWRARRGGLLEPNIAALTVDPTNSGILYAAGQFGVFKSLDGGASWNPTGLHSSAESILATSVVVDPSTPATIYASTFGRVYKSVNGGASWSHGNIQMDNGGGSFTTSRVFCVALDPNNRSTLYAGAFDGVYKSVNGGSTWTKSSSGFAQNITRVSRIVLDPSNSQILYAATPSGIYKSTNSATHWATVNNGLLSTSGTTPSVASLAISPASPATIYAATSAGVFKSSDGGLNWNPFNDGLRVQVLNGDAFIPPISTIAISPAEATTIYAGSTQGGVFKSTDGGAHWAAVNNGLDNIIVTSLAVDHSAAATLYVSTNSLSDGFVVKLNATGANLGYLRYLGGYEDDFGAFIAVDAGGNAYVTGDTRSTNFPTLNPAQAIGGGVFYDAFVTKFGSDGSTLYSTYLGGAGNDRGIGIAINAAGNAYVTGSTNSTNFPTAGSRLTSNISGIDAFVSKLNVSGSSLDYSILHGGNSSDQGVAIALDASDNVYVTGSTTSTNFPVVNGVQAAHGGGTDAFVLKLNPASEVIYSTYLGGSNNDQGLGIAVDRDESAYIAGSTNSPNFPTVSPVQASHRGINDAFVAKISNLPIPPSVIDLSMTMTDAPDPVVLGGDLTYTIRVGNLRELTATGVRLTDTLPAGSVLVSATPSTGTCSGANTVICDLGNIAGGASATVTLVIKPPAVRTITNTAGVTANEPEVSTANNTASQSTQVDFADLKVAKTLSHDLVKTGAKIIYFVKVTNLGGVTAGAVTLTDNLPVGVTFASCTSPGRFVCGGVGNNRTATIPSLAVGESESLILTASVDASVAGGTLISNTANISSNLSDPNTADNQSTATATVTDTPIRPWSNGKIAYTNSTSAEVRAVNADGSGKMSYSNRLGNAGSPAWSPDGSKIAFWANGQHQRKVHVMNADGTGLKIIDVEVGIETDITWSPRGTHLAFMGIGNSIYLAQADGADVIKLISNSPLVKSLDWSPDGQKFAFERDGVIYLMDIDGSNTGRLTGDAANPSYLPKWSPDGSKILFERFRASYIINADGTEETKLFNHSTREASWSPDGTKLVFVLQQDLSHPQTIATINLDGTGQTEVTNDSSGSFRAHISEPDWQPLPGASPTPTPTPKPAYSISGQVILPLTAFVQVALSGTINAVADIDGNGNYSFTRLPAGGNYTVTPVNPSFTFDPAARTFDNLSANQTNVNFTLTGTSNYSISGRVTDTNGAPLGNIEVSLNPEGSSPETTRTAADGAYAFNHRRYGQNHTVFVPLSSRTQYDFEPDARTFNLTKSEIVNFVGAPKNGFQFSTNSYTVGEGDGHATILVTRAGSLAAIGAPASVTLQTYDDPAAVPCDPTLKKPDGTAYPRGTAYARCDYATTVETLQFAAGETQKTVNIPIIDDAHVEGTETLLVRLNNKAGAPLEVPGGVNVVIHDNDTGTAHDPTRTTSFFVRQHYLDFLSREPEAGEPWSGVLNRCANPFNLDAQNPSASCDRIIVSQSFFGSPEFRLKGFFVYNFYRVAFGRLPEYAEIVPDMSALSGATAAEVYARRAAFPVSFNERQEFKTRYDALSDTAYVNALLNRYNLPQITTSDPQQPEAALKVTLTRAELISRLGAAAGSAQALTRAQVLRAVVESDEVGAVEYKGAFVAMQYYGYLRRTPEESGYQAWLRVITEDPNNIRIMVNGFMNSAEYRLRFGQP